MTRGQGSLVVVATLLSVGLASAAFAAHSLPGASAAVLPDVAGAAWARPGPALRKPLETVQLAQAGSKSDELKERLRRLQEQIKILKNRDTVVPIIQVMAPEKVDLRKEFYQIFGLVADDGSPPKLTINGKEVELFKTGGGTPQLAKYTFAFNFQVKVTKEDEQRFIFEARDDAGNRIAEEVVVMVVASGRPKFKGAYYALIIGNSEYDFLPQIGTAVNDATVISRLIQKRYVFEKENVSLLLNASRRQILSEFTKLRKKLKKDDRLLVYYSGHGLVDEATGGGFWQGSDADELDDFTWVATDDINRYLKGMQAKHVLVLADSVFPTGRNRGSHRRSGRDRFFEETDSFVSRKIITSGVPRPTANEKSGDHSVFAFYLIKALTDNDQPYITSTQLFAKFVRDVTVNSDQIPEHATVMNTGDEGGGDFTFILRVKALAGSG